MGLFSTFVAYRAGVKRARRESLSRAESDEIPEELLDVCDNCGYRRMQHDDTGRCPRYD